MAKTVLVVDDIEFVRKTLSEILTQAHYQVVGEAAEGNEAVNLFLKLRPDVITMDVVMPGMGGIEAAKKILKIEKNAKIVIISAMGQEHLVMEAINLGVRDYIIKPFSAQDVVKAVERALMSDQSSFGRASQKEKSG